MSEKISINTKIIGGKPRIDGTRVSIDQIYEMHKDREMSPKEIAEVLPTVGEKEIKAAIKYAEEHEISKQKNSNQIVLKS